MRTLLARTLGVATSSLFLIVVEGALAQAISTDNLESVGKAPLSPSEAVALCVKGDAMNFPGGYTHSVDALRIEFLPPVDASTIGAEYKLPVATGPVYPVKFQATKNKQDWKRLDLRKFIFKDAFSEWKCR